MNILMVMTSHDELGTTGRKTGVWLDEFAQPYYDMLDGGATVTLASPYGGRPPIDPGSEVPSALTNATARFASDPVAQAAFHHSEPLMDMHANHFGAVFYCGGHGPLWDLVENVYSLSLLQAFAASEKPIAAVCHGPMALKNVRLSSGAIFLTGRHVTGFSNSEEEAVGLAEIVPESLENALIARGATYSKGAVDFQPYVVVDGTLITGQNPASSGPVATTLLEMMAVRH